MAQNINVNSVQAVDYKTVKCPKCGKVGCARATFNHNLVEIYCSTTYKTYTEAELTAMWNSRGKS